MTTRTPLLLLEAALAEGLALGLKLKQIKGVPHRFDLEPDAWVRLVIGETTLELPVLVPSLWLMAAPEMVNARKAASDSGVVESPAVEIPTTIRMVASTKSHARQTTMRGLGDAILTAERLVGDQPFAVVLADDLCFGENHNEGEGVLAQMVKLYQEFHCCIVAIEEVPREQLSKFGVIAGSEIRPGLYRVNNMVEKPKPADAPSNLAIIGRYILLPEIFTVLRNTPAGKNGEVQITDALMALAKQGKVIGYQFKGRRFDCGSIDGFVDATNYCYQNIYKSI